MKHSEKSTKQSTKKLNLWGMNYSSETEVKKTTSYETQNEMPSLPIPRAPKLNLWMSVRLFILSLIYG